MEGKLIKQEKEYYALYTNKGIFISDVNGGSLANRLSLKNCEAIENGYDLDELAIKHFGSFGIGLERAECFKAGFQKALSILGDKKFSVWDIQNFIDNENPGQYPYIALQLKQKSNEFDVEIEMEYQGFEEDGKLKEACLPKLDADGCLILRRI